MDDEMREVIDEFLVESHENLDQLDRDFVTLERAPGDLEVLASVFRTIHTIKGTAGFLAFSNLEALTHTGESLLSRLRDGDLQLTGEITSGLLAMVDAVRGMLSVIEATGGDGDDTHAELIERLARLNVCAEPADEADEQRVGEILVEQQVATPSEVDYALRQQEEGDPLHVGEILVEKGALQPHQVREALQVQQEQQSQREPEAPEPEARPHPVPAEPHEQHEPHGQKERRETPAAARETSIADNSIRVDVALLDKLMNLVGELVLARNQIMQHTATSGDTSLVATTQHLNLVTTELQEGVMKTRMQPIGNVWNKFPRVVRDLAKGCGKQVRLEMDGKDTDLDKSILEAIKDPLTHLVRNSVDHGIETPEERVAAGKPTEGVVTLRAYHEGGLVNIEISDDGAGIDIEKVRAKAVEKALISPDRAAQMADREVANLIFMPGFSTAAKVTNVSGRGVGMDVVKTNIEKIGGTIDLANRPGLGATVKIKIPLTLAIIPALVVENGVGCYAIPQVSLVELVRVESDKAASAIEMIHGAPTYRLRGNLLPLVFLDAELGVETGSDEQRATNIVVLRADTREFGVVVDTIRDTEEIVVKPLDKQLKDIAVFAGATIMGDGRVALILDVLGLAQRAHVVAETSESAAVQALDRGTASDTNLQTLLVLGVGANGRLALPLSAVARLEEFKRDAVETAGGFEVVQYRGHIMPLVDIGGYLGMPRRYDDEPSDGIPVVVYEHRGRSVGLVIDEILDIVDTQMTIEPVADRIGIVGAAVIEGHVTDVLDVVTIVESALPPSVFADELLATTAGV